MLSAIVATDMEDCIGKGGFIPWKCKEDMKYFKEKTLYHPIIMGRKTWETIPGGKLKDRINIVISSIPRKEESWDLMFANSFANAVAKAHDCSPYNEYGGKEIFVAGGQSVYEYFFNRGHLDKIYRIDRIYKNVIKTKVEDGDAFFPSFFDIGGEWECVEEKDRGDFISYIYDRV